MGDKELKGNIHKLINRIDQRAESRKERADIRSAQTEWKRQERQKQIEQGKKPFFRRQSDIAKEHRAQKETEKRSKMDSRQIAKSDAKKVKKQAQREKKDMPKRRELKVFNFKLIYKVYFLLTLFIF